jgi:transcription-repair coupling factor (superfamily II helicase)
LELVQDKTVSEILSRLEATRDGKGVVKVEGSWGSFARLLTAYISEKLNRPILYICPHIDDADKAADDLLTFTGKRIEGLGAWEGEEDLADATDEIRAERLKLVSRISHRASSSYIGNFIIPASIQALCQPIPKPQALQKSCLKLQVEGQVRPEEVVEWLFENGFERVERIDLPGQFARRGGIIDIYAPLTVDKVLSDKEPASTPSQNAQAIRIEFFGDTIESIREINLDTQLSTEQIESINIISAVCGTAQEERELFVNILPQNCIIILEEPTDCEEVARLFRERAEDTSRLYSWSDIYKAIEKFTQLHICRFATAEPGDFL